MFTIHCPREDATVLLGSRRIRRLEHTPDGIVVHWTCYCGATGRNAPTGQAATDRPTAQDRVAAPRAAA